MEQGELRTTAASLRRAAVGLARRLRDERTAEAPGRLGLSLLGHLRRRGAMTAGELAAAEHLQPQSITRALASLEEGGLIRRSRDEDDRRRHLLVLTDKGAEVLADQVKGSDARLAEAMSRALTPEECRVLGVAADLIERLLDDRPGGASPRRGP
ncbi:MarR family transcriptional regulator [Nonomuraea sp. 3-1Str]|uniref:MarR family winged helix-turn-helix transcriptional regulator n=1 Tax=Nonomuraea sp. 3-1Str TaxID=2929801 RepID=UPI00285F5F40|nr:MarR family transcriptional regulator [Nonomuraea sp. 3-1Str]MDR8413381.1 MarR family transcriptional regulator [Nonomuraea sp. 3-1Str]